MEDHVAELQLLIKRIRAVEKRIIEATTNDPVVAQLLTLPGVGLVTAVTLRAEVGRFDRFDTGKQLARFCGVTPRNAISGARQADAGLIKAGNPDLAKGVDRVGSPTDSHGPRPLGKALAPACCNAANQRMWSWRRWPIAGSVGCTTKCTAVGRTDLGSGSTKGGRPFHLRHHIDLRRGEGQRDGEDERGSREDQLQSKKSSASGGEARSKTAWAHQSSLLDRATSPHFRNTHRGYAALATDARIEEGNHR